jgi:hypothetical protein
MQTLQEHRSTPVLRLVFQQQPHLLLVEGVQVLVQEPPIFQFVHLIPQFFSKPLYTHVERRSTAAA